jgi:hypothetical protein
MQNYLDGETLVQAAIQAANASVRTRSANTRKTARRRMIANIKAVLDRKGGAVTALTSADAAEIRRWLTAAAAGKVSAAMRNQINARAGRVTLQASVGVRGGKPTVSIQLGRDAPMQSAAVLGAALLVGDSDQWRARLGQCKCCDEFFIARRRERGKTRQVVCSQKCRDKQKYLRRLAR